MPPLPHWGVRADLVPSPRDAAQASTRHRILPCPGKALVKRPESGVLSVSGQQEDLVPAALQPWAPVQGAEAEAAMQGVMGVEGRHASLFSLLGKAGVAAVA